MRSQQGSSTGKHINKQVLSILVDLLRQGLGTYFESEAIPTSARSNGQNQWQQMQPITMIRVYQSIEYTPQIQCCKM